MIVAPLITSFLLVYLLNVLLLQGMGTRWTNYCCYDLLSMLQGVQIFFSLIAVYGVICFSYFLKLYIEYFL